MGPRIILRGAIPSDSNIGGLGHRPLLKRCVLVVCWCALSLAVFVFPSSKSLVCLVVVACWAVLPLVVRGTTAYVDKRYYRPPERYYRWGAGPGGYVGAGGGFVSPIPIRTVPSFLLSFCLVLRSCIFGAIVVASLDF